MSDEPQRPLERGYGNIYTPHAGAMIIHVQRESGLANRTIILSQRQVRLLRIGGLMAGIALAVGALTWFFLAAQAVRVPLLTERVTRLQHDVARLDTLQRALTELEERYQQVQKMMGAAPAPTLAATGTSPGTPVIDSSSIPREWPLPVAGALMASDSGSTAVRRAGVDIEVPSGTPIRAAGSGTVVQVTDDSLTGQIVRIRHSEEYETLYGNASDVRVRQGDHVTGGTVIGVVAVMQNALPAHLHFEVRRRGVAIDPTTIMTKGPAHGDLQ